MPGVTQLTIGRQIVTNCAKKYGVGGIFLQNRQLWRRTTFKIGPKCFKKLGVCLASKHEFWVPFAICVCASNEAYSWHVWTKLGIDSTPLGKNNVAENTTMLF